MPAGYDLTGPDRTNFRRHFSDRDYGILATNVGLSVETMHNWTMVTPNAQQAASLAIDFLFPLPSISITWSYGGPQSPWINSTVSGPTGTTVFKGQTYSKYRITWSTGNPAWTFPSPGVLSRGHKFHIGTTFTGVDFNKPDPIIITDVTLLDASSTPLALHPRLPSYDAGTIDSTLGLMVISFSAPPSAPQLRFAGATILQLPQLATIDALVGEGRPFTRDRRPIQAWTSTRCAPAPLQKGVRCTIARVTQKPHVLDTFRIGEAGVVDCRRRVPPVPGPGPVPGAPQPPHDRRNPAAAGAPTRAALPQIPLARGRNPGCDGSPRWPRRRRKAGGLARPRWRDTRSAAAAGRGGPLGHLGGEPAVAATPGSATCGFRRCRGRGKKPRLTLWD